VKTVTPPPSDPIKKASERVPRQGVYGGKSSLSRAADQISASLNEKNDNNPRDYLDIPLSNKPNEGDPRNNIQKTKQKNKMLE
jgi:hypothetical protein